MIVLYTYGSFNGRQVSIVLEELDIDYVVHKINLPNGEHNTPSFRQINPSGRIPVIIDLSVSADKPLILSQTSAILIYLAEKHGKLLTDDVIQRARTLEWLAFHATDQSPALFNEFYLNSLVEIPQLEASSLLRKRTLDLYQYFDQQLEKTIYLAGDNYSIADIAAYPAISSIINDLSQCGYLNIYRWFKLLSERPAVMQGMRVPV